MTNEKKFDKSLWGEMKRAERENAYAMINETIFDIKEDITVLPKILEVMARFNKYSAANVLLIAHQKSNATKLLNSDEAKYEGGYINKGSRGIILFEKGEEYTKSDGTKGRRYNTKKYFDISQTNLPTAEKGYVSYDLRLLNKALIANAPCVVEVVRELPDDQNVVYAPYQPKVQLKEGVVAEDGFRNLIQGITYAYSAKNRTPSDRFIAYCVEYVVCRMYGIDTHSFDYNKVPDGFTDRAVEEIRNMLGNISRVSQQIRIQMAKTLERPTYDKGER